jgi:hypothetical protein
MTLDNDAFVAFVAFVVFVALPPNLAELALTL